jgi:hypothetical protein
LVSNAIISKVICNDRANFTSAPMSSAEANEAQQTRNGLQVSRIVRHFRDRNQSRRAIDGTSILRHLCAGDGISNFQHRSPSAHGFRPPFGSARLS